VLAKHIPPEASARQRATKSLRQCALVVVAGAGDLGDHRHVRLKLREALHLRDHLRTLVGRRGDECLQPANRYWVLIELLRNAGILVVERRHHLWIGAR